MSWSAIVPSLIALLGIPLAALLTLWRENHLRRQQYQDWVSQRWWERKAVAYTEIVEAVWQRSEYAREYLDYLYGPQQRSVDDKAEKYRDMDKNRTNLRKVSDVGAFVISNEVAASLQRYFKAAQEMMRIEDPTEQVEADVEASHLCLQEVREAALRDLKITRPSSTPTLEDAR
ncbi:MAG: hypothetical protein ACRDJH_15235 [Thermomicrobiales bacterium]